MKISQLAIKSIFVLCIMMMVGYACVVNPVTGKKQISLMSEQQELALGKQSDPSIVAHFGKYDDDKIQAFINEKGKEMAAISHRPDLPYEFKVLDSPVINAFAVPGGYVYFTRGILAHFNNEAEFAGVLGHEIGHITGRHSALAQTKQMLGQLGFLGAMIALPGAREFAQPLSQGMQMLFLKHSRDHESQSDKLGVEYSTAVGYDAHQMADFFNTLKRKQVEAGVNIPTFQSTHPDPGDRFNRVHSMAEDIQAEKGGSYAVNRNEYLRMIDGLVYGEDPKGGYVEDDFFYHPVIKFKFPVPRGWRTANSPSQFQMADQQGKGMMVLTLAQGSTPEAAAQAFNEKHQTRPTRGQRTQVNGLNAYYQVADFTPQQQQGQTQQGQALRILTYFIQYDGNIYEITGVAQPTDYANFERTFLYTMQGFAVLTDPSKINRKPDRLKIATVQRNGTLSSTLQSFGMPQEKMEELSLLNGMQLNEQIQSGMLIKLVEYDYLNRQNTGYIPSNSRTQPAPATNTPTNTTNTQTGNNTNTGHLPPPPRTNTNTNTNTKTNTNTNTNTQTQPKTTTKTLPGKIKKKGN